MSWIVFQDMLLAWMIGSRKDHKIALGLGHIMIIMWQGYGIAWVDTGLIGLIVL